MEPNERPDLFDRLMALPGLRLLEPFYKKHKSVLLYLFFGGLTTVISIAVFWLFRGPLGLDALVANVISWLAAVLFAFLTNRVWVFASPTKTAGEFLRQMGSFYGGRVATLLIEEAILAVFITWLGLPDMPVKIAAQVVVIVLNYFISKLFVFKKRDTGGTDDGLDRN